MNDLKHMRNGDGPEGPDDEIRLLMEEAGPRDEIPAEDLATIKAAARVAWKEKTRETSFFSRGRWLAIAAIVAGMALGGLLWLNVGVSSVDIGPVASVERVHGRAATADGVLLTKEFQIEKDQLIETAEEDSVASLRLSNGASLRLDANTRIRLSSGSRIELARGAIYVDNKGASSGVEVSTAFGVARDIGTQFVVRLTPDGASMFVGVREGEVVLDRAGSEYSVEAGGELVIHSDGVLESGTLEAWDDVWKWVQDAAPRFDIEGQSLEVFLDHVARESGLRVEFVDTIAAASASEIVLHGATGELRADEAALIVLEGAGLHGRIEDGVLEITLASD